MALNPYFHAGYAKPNEQGLIERLMIEQIKQYGYMIKYLPRETVDMDEIFWEDSLHRFDYAIDVEVYVEPRGFQGEGDILSKFGLEVRDEITFTVARRRWEQITTEKLISEEGWNYQLEVANTLITTSQSSYSLEDGDGDNFTILNQRPREGDIIYFPLVDRLFTIQHVEHETLFYNLGRLLTYDLRCELLEYSSERLDTGVTAIDSVEDAYSADILFNELLMEDGSKYLNEKGGSYVLEQNRIDDVDNKAGNEEIQGETEGVLDWSEHNPFSETRRY